KIEKRAGEDKSTFLMTRLAVHLPKVKYLRQLAKGLMIGKISYAAAAAVPIPRLDNECKGQIPHTGRYRSIVGCKRRDPHPQGLPSLNEVAAKAVALETGNAFTPTTVAAVAGTQLVTSSSPIPRRPMRSTTPVAYPLGRETATFACHAISVWNMNKALRSATTLHAARTAARAIGRSVPT
ncbi:Hypothetical protein FKW44_020221, partial [Caligus rogercresseyi]